jgi:hypothetical protein
MILKYILKGVLERTNHLFFCYDTDLIENDASNNSTLLPERLYRTGI